MSFYIFFSLSISYVEIIACESFFVRWRDWQQLTYNSNAKWNCFPCYCTDGRIESWPWPSLYILENSGRPTPKYTKVGERLRHVIPGHMACSMACGGRACKYENPARWSEQEQAIKGVYSSWWVWLWGLHSCVGWKGAGALMSQQQAEWGDVGLACIPGFTSRPVWDTGSLNLSFSLTKWKWLSPKLKWNDRYEVS